MFDDIETAAADESVRQALGLSASKTPRARWIGLRLDTQPDGSRRVVGVCLAHNTPHGCPGHALALRYLSDATACCAGCGRAVASTGGVKHADGGLGEGRAVLGAGGRVTGWNMLHLQASSMQAVKKEMMSCVKKALCFLHRCTHIHPTLPPPPPPHTLSPSYFSQCMPAARLSRISSYPSPNASPAATASAMAPTSVTSSPGWRASHSSR